MASFKSIRAEPATCWPRCACPGAFCPIAKAQQQASGFAVERLYQSAPGAGWFVMDDLDISGRFGGAVEATSGYERNPLVITGPDGKQKLAVVSQEAFLDIGGSITHDRFRGYINFPMPLLVTGTSGTLGPYQFTAPVGKPRDHSRYHLRWSNRRRRSLVWQSRELRFVWVREHSLSSLPETAPIT